MTQQQHPMKRTVVEFQGERLALTYPCKWCAGSGVYDGGDFKEECAGCHGKGEVERQLELHEIDYR